MQTNYKAPLIKSLGEAGLRTTGTYGGARMTFTQRRKNGQRRIKLWLAKDVFDAPRDQQLLLEQALKRNYPTYLGGYFVQGAQACGPHARSFCVVINDK